jgi:predicted GNAT family acetyltransferase
MENACVAAALGHSAAMTWQFSDDVDAFLAAAGEQLRARPVENTRFLTVAHAERTRRTPGARYGWHDEHGVFLSSPPYPPTLSAMPAHAAAEIAQLLAASDVSQISGPTAVIEAFSAKWPQRVHSHQRKRLYRLDTLIPPARMPPGAARLAVESDRALVVEWAQGFERAVGEHVSSGQTFANERLARRNLFLWEDGAEPVSMAALSVPQAAMTRVQAVYTPRVLRGRGYAGAITAFVATHALHAGAKDVVLYADLANPTSNALYLRLGFVPVEDLVTVKLNALA